MQVAPLRLVLGELGARARALHRDGTLDSPPTALAPESLGRLLPFPVDTAENHEPTCLQGKVPATLLGNPHPQSIQAELPCETQGRSLLAGVVAINVVQSVLIHHQVRNLPHALPQLLPIRRDRLRQQKDHLDESPIGHLPDATFRLNDQDLRTVDPPVTDQRPSRGYPPPTYRDGPDYAPPRGAPNGPSRNYESPGPRAGPPTGPSAAPISMSAHNRPGNVSVLSAPTQPRGGSGPPPRRESSYSGPPPGRDRRGPPPGHYPPPIHPRGGPPSSSYRGTSPNADSPGPPGGPPNRGPLPPYRPSHHSHNSTSRTYPLTQRFGRHTADLPAVKAGGEKQPSSVEKSVADRLAKLQADQKRLETELAEKLEKKRAGLRGWDRMERESAREGLKSELAEQQVRAMAGEGGVGGAAF
ncbi:MAG: hypothetical protein M1833_003294 [Piccolia ochrophora]|nr:MAG: hypothetical protein M1833_003294 [Piccolia ochrophora]